MAVYQGITFDGSVWEPRYIEAIDPQKCIGCGRCFKTCARNVLDLVDYELDDEDCDDDYDDMEDKEQRMVMVAAHPGDCIGCEACYKVCSKQAISHRSKEI